MESDDLGADQVLAVLKVRELDSDLSLVVDELLNSPSAVGETLLEDLGPDGTLTVGIGLGHVDHDRSLMRLGNGLVLVTRLDRTVVVVPLEGDLGAGLGLDEVGGSLTTIADHSSGGNIEDRVVAVGWGLDSKVLAHVLAIDDEGLEGGVRSSELSSSGGDGK